MILKYLVRIPFEPESRSSGETLKSGCSSVRLSISRTSTMFCAMMTTLLFFTHVTKTLVEDNFNNQRFMVNNKKKLERHFLLVYDSALGIKMICHLRVRLRGVSIHFAWLDKISSTMLGEIQTYDLPNFS